VCVSILFRGVAVGRPREGLGSASEGEKLNFPARGGSIHSPPDWLHVDAMFLVMVWFAAIPLGRFRCTV
jgi:hypothetical protein